MLRGNRPLVSPDSKFAKTSLRCSGGHPRQENAPRRLVTAQVACGDHHCLALASNKIYAWGYGDMNALGLGKEGSDRFAPEVVTVKLDGGAVATAFTQVAGGGQHSMVVAAVEGRA